MIVMGVLNANNRDCKLFIIQVGNVKSRTLKSQLYGLSLWVKVQNERLDWIWAELTGCVICMDAS